MKMLEPKEIRKRIRVIRKRAKLIFAMNKNWQRDIRRLEDQCPHKNQEDHVVARTNSVRTRCKDCGKIWFDPKPMPMDLSRLVETSGLD